MVKVAVLLELAGAVCSSLPSEVEGKGAVYSDLLLLEAEVVELKLNKQTPVSVIC